MNNNNSQETETEIKTDIENNIKTDKKTDKISEAPESLLKNDFQENLNNNDQTYEEKKKNYPRVDLSENNLNKEESENKESESAGKDKKKTRKNKAIIKLDEQLENIKENNILLSDRKKDLIYDYINKQMKKYPSSKLNKSTIEIISKLLRKGSTIQVIADYLNITDKAIYLWLSQAKKVTEQIDEIKLSQTIDNNEKKKLIKTLLFNKNNLLLIELLEEYNKAKHELRIKAEERIYEELTTKGAKWGVLAAQWVLENRYSQDYRKDAGNGTGSVNIQINIPESLKI